MAGHSKWKNIKHKKAATDAKKAKKFTKLLKEITVSARTGGGELSSNPHLRHLIEKAHEMDMPKDNYLRAIKRGTGELEGGHYEPHMYEGYGPGNIAVIVEVLTDNKNRAASEIRLAFQRNGGSLGEAGSVIWAFDRKGLISAKCPTMKEDQLLELLLNFKIDDISWHDLDVSIVSDVHDLQNIKKILTDNGCIVDEAEVGYHPKTTLDLFGDEEAGAIAFLDVLEELDDVQHIYTNLS